VRDRPAARGCGSRTQALSRRGGYRRAGGRMRGGSRGGPGRGAAGRDTGLQRSRDRCRRGRPHRRCIRLGGLRRSGRGRNGRGRSERSRDGLPCRRRRSHCGRRGRCRSFGGGGRPLPCHLRCSLLGDLLGCRPGLGSSLVGGQFVKMFANLVGRGQINRARMRFLLLHADFWQVFDDQLCLDFQLASQLIDPNLVFVRHGPRKLFVLLRLTGPAVRRFRWGFAAP
jgi:hypothetical protein